MVTQTERSTGGRIDVLGAIWQPGFDACAMTYSLTAYDVGNMRGRTLARGGGDRSQTSITRADVEDWLGANSGDFQSITDFAASIDDGPLPACDACGHVRRKVIGFPWSSEENEFAFQDAMFGTEEEE